MTLTIKITRQELVLILKAENKHPKMNFFIQLSPVSGIELHHLKKKFQFHESLYNQQKP